MGWADTFTIKITFTRGSFCMERDLVSAGIFGPMAIIGSVFGQKMKGMDLAPFLTRMEKSSGRGIGKMEGLKANLIEFETEN